MDANDDKKMKYIFHSAIGADTYRLQTYIDELRTVGYINNYKYISMLEECIVIYKYLEFILYDKIIIKDFYDLIYEQLGIDKNIPITTKYLINNKKGAKPGIISRTVALIKNLQSILNKISPIYRIIDG